MLYRTHSVCLYRDHVVTASFCPSCTVAYGAVDVVGADDGKALFQGWVYNSDYLFKVATSESFLVIAKKEVIKGFSWRKPQWQRQ